MTLSWQIEFARPLWLATLAGLPLWIVFWRRSLVRLSAAPPLSQFFCARYCSRSWRPDLPGQPQAD